jgi:hypothetical protein
MSELTDFYIKQLEQDKQGLEQQIEELRREVATINNLIYRRKSQSFADEREEKINRKNVDRVFFESLIVTILREAEGGLRTAQIFKKTEKLGYKINYNTFRAYITNMRDKKIINKRTSDSYYWVVSSTT